MAFTVAPTLNYNSYASVAAADTFHQDRGNTAWAALTNTAKEQALVRASDYIAANYTFSINPVSDDVEPALVTATSILALYSVTVDLFPVESSTITTSDEKSLAGVGSVKATYSRTKADRFPIVSNMLANIASYAPALNVPSAEIGLIIR